MKLATGILILGLGLGTGAAQNPSIIDNTKAKLNAVQQQKTADSNAALAASHGQSASTQTSSATKQASAPAPAKPSASKPATSNVKTAQPASQAANKSMSPAASKQPAPAANQKAVPAASKQSAATASPFSAPKAATSATTAASKTTAAKAAVPETKNKSKNKKKTTTVAVKKPAQAKSTVAVEDKKNPDPKKDEHKTISMAGGRRDPFLSPVVNHSMGGSGCSTGKRCLAVDQIALQGIVKSDAGMIAVVVNAMNKAYFLRENDPVFNGYVVKITGDSIVFKETLQDKLGKSFTREVTKKISTPAV
jgi:Tfp pilus assembly protein PilP